MRALVRRPVKHLCTKLSPVKELDLLAQRVVEREACDSAVATEIARFLNAITALEIRNGRRHTGAEPAADHPVEVALIRVVIDSLDDLEVEIRGWVRDKLPGARQIPGDIEWEDGL